MTKWKAVVLQMSNKGKAMAPPINNASLHFMMNYVLFLMRILKVHVGLQYRGDIVKYV